MWNRIYIALILACTMCACSARQHIFPFSLGVELGEACQTLDVADSLRVNEGRLYDDSLALAEAYTLLGHWRLIYPDDYARACYYYGYLLRQHNNQVAAMQAFIAGSHAPYVSRVVRLPWFSNYHILGRIYSNMGTMCHSAGEYQLSYEMYNKSADYFLIADDSTGYYYTLNNEAFELATLHQYDEAFQLLNSINSECDNPDILTAIWETKAQLYFKAELYDSVITAVNNLQQRGDKGATGYTKKAQAFWYLQQYDSALNYANIVVCLPYASAKDKYNMMYILAYNDDSIDIQEVKRRSEERADIDKEILDPLHIQLAQAIDILLQDRDKKPYYISIGILIIVVCILAMTSRIAVLRIKRHRKQSIETIEAKFSELQHDISEQRQKLYAETRYEQQKQFSLQQQQQQLFAEHLAIIEQNCIAIRSSNNIPASLCWKDFDQMCRYVNDAFFMFVTKLTAAGKFNEYEVRLCVLVLLDLDYETISHILKRAQNGIGKAKYRVAQKLGTTTGNLRQVLINLAIDASIKDI